HHTSYVYLYPYSYSILFFTIHPPHTSTLFPYTTLFRSDLEAVPRRAWSRHPRRLTVVGILRARPGAVARHGAWPCAQDADDGQSSWVSRPRSSRDCFQIRSEERRVGKEG